MKDKIKFGVSVPGTPISLTIAPRDILDKAKEGVDFIRGLTQEIDLIKLSQDYQRRQANK